ncbi:Methyl-CPG-binding domain protein 13, putative isoform 1 [Hibiscus syriacus]|uniref:Methyl-CPG-binding domain protein 13, putative isoform 1 n=1 Tax=Hibiscus syriacus TaxID=106335 RepID=A0A6A3D6M3_HIBSY|nr:Methyl-CPG-binding domain protein 13, putative isoform 1 [Hibiscus syriacus]
MSGPRSPINSKGQWIGQWGTLGSVDNNNFSVVDYILEGVAVGSGVIESQPSFQDPLQDLQIGQLCRPSFWGIYTFTIGYHDHELTWSKVELKKPMVVLKKTKCMGVDRSDDASSSSAELDVVVGVIRHKIFFKSRLKALISVKEKANTADAAALKQSV